MLVDCGFSIKKQVSLRKCGVRSGWCYGQFIENRDVPYMAKSKISDVATQKRKDFSILGGHTEEISVSKKV